MFGNRFLSKSVLFLSTLVLVALLIYQCFVSGRFFLARPTFATSEFLDQKDAVLPDTSFCFTDTMDENLDDFEYVWSKIEFVHARFFTIDKNDDKINIRYTPKSDKESLDKAFIIRNNPKVGTCVTYIHDEYKHLGLYYLRLNLKSATRVFIHQRDDFWRSTIKDPGMVVEYGTVTQVQVNHNDVRTLPSDENDCSFENHDQCIENHAKRMLLNETGCRPSTFKAQGLEVCEDSALQIKAEEIAIEALNHECKVSCKFLDIRTGARNFEPSSKETKFYGYFTYKVPVSTESYFYTGLELIAEVGGMAGLLLGISFYHLAKLIDFLIDIQIKKLEEEKRKMRNNIA